MAKRVMVWSSGQIKILCKEKKTAQDFPFLRKKMIRRLADSYIIIGSGGVRRL